MSMPSPFGQQPPGMFDRSPPPAYWTPFNVNMGTGAGPMALQMLMPSLMQSMSGSRNMPAQFLPTQNLWDQFQSQRYWRGQQEAMQRASQQDVAGLHQTLMGAQRLGTGRNVTMAEQQQLRGMAEAVGTALPTLAMLPGGAEWIDVLAGPGGSATIMAQRMHRGLRTSRDPVTGAQGVSGRAAGMMSQEIFGQLYGPGADIGEMRGMRAGRAGALFDLLQQRGMAGSEVGGQTSTSRMQGVATAIFNEGSQRRVAEAYLRGQGQEVTTEAMTAAQQQIFGQGGTLGQIREGVAGGGGNTDIQRLMEMAGTEELITSSQAQTISSRLKNMSGAVSAMRDIFGDAGSPNAPMREIIQGLDALTQGGMATMTPGQLEQTVRMTRNLAATSGLGMQAMLGLTAQNADLADRLGLDRTLAVGATQAAAARASAVRQTQRLDIPAFGGLTAEEQVILEGQLQMGAAASQVGNMLNATVRMEQEKLIDPGSDAARMARAARANRDVWVDAAGDEQRMAMDNAEWLKIMERSGVTRSTAETILKDKRASQQYGRDFGLTSLARNMQREVDYAPRIGNEFGRAIRRQMLDQDASQALLDLGMSGNQLNDIAGLAGAQAGREFFDLPAKQMRTPIARNKAIGQLARDALAEQIMAQDPAITPAQLDTVLAVLDTAEMGAAMQAKANVAITNYGNMSGNKSILGVWQTQNPTTQARQRAIRAEMQTESRMQEALSGIGRHGPVGRMVQMMQDTPEGMSLQDILAQTAGAIPIGDLQETPLGAAYSAIRRFEHAERYTEETARRAVMDAEIAKDKNISLSTYQQQIREAAGDDRARLIAERDQERARLRDDQAFLARSADKVAGLQGVLTDRGQAAQELNSRILGGLAQGGRRATEAREQIARFLGGEEAVVGGMDKQRWNEQIERAASPAARQRILDLRNAYDVLQGAAAGITTGTQLEALGATEEAFQLEQAGRDKQEREEMEDAAADARRIQRSHELGLDPLSTDKEVQAAEYSRMTPAERVKFDVGQAAEAARAAAGDASQVKPAATDVSRDSAGAGAGAGGQDKRVTAVMSGTITVNGLPGQISGDMTVADYLHNDVQTGLVGAPGGVV